MHAFLVTLHHDAPMAGRLTARLSEAGVVHAHVNARVDDGPFRAFCPQARFTSRRYPIRWGSFSLVEAVLDLAARALADPDVTRLTVVSGQHYPIVPSHVLADPPPGDRIALHPAPDPARGKPAERFSQRFYAAPEPGSWRFVAGNALARRLPRLDYAAALSGRQLRAGAMWWSLTRRTAVDLLEAHHREGRLRAYFERIACPDESYIHTLVGDVLARRATGVGGAAALPPPAETTFVPWDGFRHPAPLTPDALRAAAAGPYWFARKFTSADLDLLDLADDLAGGGSGPDVRRPGRGRGRAGSRRPAGVLRPAPHPA